jgi:hypothetical protein
MFDNPTDYPEQGYISKKLLSEIRSSGEYVFAEREEGVNGGGSLMKGG